MLGCCRGYLAVLSHIVAPFPVVNRCVPFNVTSTHILRCSADCHILSILREDEKVRLGIRQLIEATSYCHRMY